MRLSIERKQERENFKHFITFFSAIVVIIAALISVWLFFPVSISEKTKVTQIEQSKKVATDTKSKKVSQPSVTPVITNLAPDYSIPATTDGMAPVVYRMATDQNIVFLGIDDGAFKDQSVVDIMKQNNIKASLFLTKSIISGNPDFFKQLTAQGSFVEDHTLSHDTNMVTTQDYEQQKAEICGMADYEELHFGRRPTLFRPPGGAYSDTMRMAAAACGMKAVVTWIAKANGGSMQYQVGNGLRAGDVVLMHFRPEFAQDMKAFVDAMNAAGLHTALLEDAL